MPRPPTWKPQKKKHSVIAVDYGRAVKSYEADPIGPGRYRPLKVVRKEKDVVTSAYLNVAGREAEPDHGECRSGASPA
jgi:hypothetical protein